MFYTISALVGTVLMGGIIAYYGDLTGRKFGKRRVSLFGLRPKHTAIAITSVFGVFISAGTTCALFLAVPPVREVILEGENAIRAIPGLKRDRDQAVNQAADARSEMAQIEKQLKPMEESLQQVQAKLGLSRAALKRTQGQLTEAISRANLESARGELLSKRNTDLKSENATLSHARDNLVVQTAHLRAANAREQQKNDNLVKNNERLALQNDKLARANGNLTKENAGLTQINQGLTVVNGRLNDENRNLDATNAKLAATNKEMEDKNKDLDRANRRLQSDSAQIIQASADAYGRNKGLIEMNEMLRRRRVVVHTGEELAREVVPAGSTPSKVRAILDDLLGKAHEAALERGAGTGDGVRAVEIATKRIVVGTSPGTNVPITSVSNATEVTELDRINMLVNGLSRSPKPVCLLVLAVGNSVEQEPAIVDFQPFDQRLVYVKGQTVSTITLNAGEPIDQVFQDLVSFLKGVGQNSLKLGMIPHLDPVTGEPQIGSLGVVDVVKLMDKVRSRRGEVRVIALASADTDSGDELKLSFKLEKPL